MFDAQYRHRVAGTGSEGRVAMKLLIAEDDSALGLFLSRGLEADGHRVRWRRMVVSLWKRFVRICRT